MNRIQQIENELAPVADKKPDGDMVEHKKEQSYGHVH